MVAAVDVSSIDFTALTGVELGTLLTLCHREAERRRYTDPIPQSSGERASDYLEAVGRLATRTPEGGVPEALPAWVQPCGAHDAYPKGALVLYEHTAWESTLDANVWPPGVGDMWVRAETSVPPTPTAPEAQEWDPNARPYVAGERVTYHGRTFEVVQAHTSQPGWAPDTVPALYTPAS